ncbi:MAG: hypothetical protein D4R84_08940 [Rhodocyclaceae bacterium]|nr:MAG: hypothetical protein D4R84_08940 [Rhodocyclaceae bacterium]
MAGEGIYHKTEKGRAEIATRANKLGLRERTMLIMVDDKTSRGGLLSRSAHPSSGEILDALLAQGFIEVAGESASAGSGSGPTASGAVQSVVMAPAAPVTGQPPVEISLISASRFACRALVTYLGPGADDLTALVEKCKGLEELTARLEKCRMTIQSLAGKKKADEFWSGVSARLPRE